MHAWRAEAIALGSDSEGWPPQPEMTDALARLVALRREHPEPGVLDDLLRLQAAGHRVAGKPLQDWDLAGQLGMFLLAATGTLGASIADAFLFLTEYGHWQELHEQPSLVTSAVEELLRWYPAFPGCIRVAREETVLAGQTIRRGDLLMAWLTSANRDPKRFPDPDRFDIRRDPNPHLTFGTGRHVCLGKALARLELGVVVAEASRRMPNLRLDPARPFERTVWLEDATDEAHFRF